MAIAAIAGFAGGFVGGVISTGSLSAALTAGLIGGITAGLFNYVGTLAAGDGEVGSQWDYGQRTLAHAAVGCVSAVMSSGNCGRGALSAGMSEALGPAIYHGPEIASWGGEGFATAEAGLIGGAAARAAGGEFSDGFSVSAAGYLFNDMAHNAEEAVARAEMATQK